MDKAFERQHPSEDLYRPPGLKAAHDKSGGDEEGLDAPQ